MSHTQEPGPGVGPGSCPPRPWLGVASSPSPASVGSPGIAVELRTLTTLGAGHTTTVSSAGDPLEGSQVRAHILVRAHMWEADTAGSGLAAVGMERGSGQMPGHTMLGDSR